MKYLETINLGCESDEIAEPGSSYLVRIDVHASHDYASILALIHGSFHVADLLAREVDISTPFKVCVFLATTSKKKIEDPETHYDRIKWFYRNAVPPRNGMVVSFYEMKNLLKNVATQYSFDYIWPFKEKWRGDGDYITFQRLEEALLYAPWHKNHAKESYGLQEKLISLVESEGHKVKFVDYTTPIEELYRTLISSKGHITYPGSSYTVAVALGVPVAAYSKRAKRVPPQEAKTYFDIEHNPVEIRHLLPYGGTTPGSPPLYMSNYAYDDEGKVYGIAGYPTNISNLGNNTSEALAYALQFLDEIDA